jgi:hypothetical protein
MIKIQLNSLKHGKMWLSKYVKRKLKQTNDLSVAAIPSCTSESEEPYRVNVDRFL